MFPGKKMTGEELFRTKRMTGLGFFSQEKYDGVETFTGINMKVYRCAFQQYEIKGLRLFSKKK